MIVRIMSDGQYKLSGFFLDEMNKMDNSIVSALEKEDHKLFDRKYANLVEYVHYNGKRVPAKEIIESDFILPPADVTVEEAKLFFEGEGVIPDIK